MADAGAVRQDVAEGVFLRRPVGCADGAAALGIARAAGARSANAFRGADRHPAGDRLRGGAGTDHCRQIAGTVRAQHPSVDCKERVAPGAETALALAPAGAAYARPAVV